MKKYYSRSTNGFYSTDVNKTWPNDAVEITEDKWMALLVGQSSGQVITSDNNGNPILIPPA